MATMSDQSLKLHIQLPSTEAFLIPLTFFYSTYVSSILGFWKSSTLLAFLETILARISCCELFWNLKASGTLNSQLSDNNPLT